MSKTSKANIQHYKGLGEMNTSVTINISSAWLANVIAFKVDSQGSKAKAIINGSKVFIVGAKVYSK